MDTVFLLSSGCVEGGNLDNHAVRYNVASEVAVRDGDLSWTVLRPSPRPAAATGAGGRNASP
jgi:hypothetical protein